MLEYQKMIIDKVSFNRGLFTRELQKSLKWLDKNEIDELKTWVYSHYGMKYRHEIESVFNRNAAA